MKPIQPPLKRNQRGQAVLDLNDALLLLHDDGRLRLTKKDFKTLTADRAAGKFGAGTSAAVLAFRKQSGLKAGKSIDQATADALNQALQTSSSEMDVAAASDGMSRVEGQVARAEGGVGSGITLRLFHRGFGGTQELLAQAVTDAQGKFVISYKPVDGATNLEVRSVQDGSEIPLSDVKFGAGSLEVMNLVAPETVKPLAPEYERLVRDLAKQLGSRNSLAAAREDDEVHDLTLLHRATGWDARLIALAATAEKLGAENALSPEAVYGLLRVGLPTEIQDLARVGAAAVESALDVAQRAGLIHLDETTKKRTLDGFKTLARETLRATKSFGGLSTVGELLANSGLAGDELQVEAAARQPSEQTRFLDALLAPYGSADEFWQRVQDAGISEEKIDTLRLQGKLAFLTRDNAPLTAVLQNEIKSLDNLRGLVDLNLYRPEDWKERIQSIAPNAETLEQLIPSAIENNVPGDRLDTYARDLAQQVSSAFPTRVIGQMIANDELNIGAPSPDVKAAVANFFKNADALGYVLGKTPLDGFLAQNQESVLASADEPNHPEILKTAQRIPRLYQIAPNLKAMSTLSNLGFDSAAEVASIKEQDFVDRYSPHFDSAAEARSVVHKAQQVTNVVYNVVAQARLLDSAPPIYALAASSEQRDDAKQALIKQFPSMSTLFGSLDFCECEDCRSVLSPAAYLVDLLEFLNPEAKSWESFLQSWKERHNGEAYDARYQKPFDALVARRPDLPHLPLTCENTNTALPYIDLVNEILEYYVAHDQLAETAARDTGDATSAELLAEPQNIIPEAYDKLAAAIYPLTLPFDLWLETVRQFCNYFEAPLARVLEIFWQSDDRTPVLMESLGLAPGEVSLLTDPGWLTQNKWHTLYGIAPQASFQDPINPHVGLGTATVLARALGITLQELVEIIQVAFVGAAPPDSLRLLSRLGISPGAAFLYRENMMLLDENFVENQLLDIPEQDLQEFWNHVDQVRAVDAQLAANADAAGLKKEPLVAALDRIAFEGVLLLATPTGSSDFQDTNLTYADGSPADPLAFLRLNLFVRLWRKLGWSIAELDAALQTFAPEGVLLDLDLFQGIQPDPKNPPLQTVLIDLAHLKALDDRFQLGAGSRTRLLTFWSNIPVNGEHSLYAQLFLTRSVLKNDPVFDHPLGDYLTADWIAVRAELQTYSVQRGDVTPDDKLDSALFAERHKVEVSYDTLQKIQHLTYAGVLTDADKQELKTLSPSPILSELLDAVQSKSREFSLLKGHLPALQGALGLTTDDIDAILTAAGTSLDAAALSLPNVSLLYRHGLLSQALNLPVFELIALTQLSGIDPFLELFPASVTASTNLPFTETLRFVEMVREIQASGLDVADLMYILRHHFDETGKYRQNADASLILLRTLAEGVRAIRTEHALPADPANVTDDFLRQKLGLALPSDIVETVLTILNGTAKFDAAQAQDIFNNYLKEQKLRLEAETGFLKENDFDLFQPLPELPGDELNATRQARRLRFARAFLPYLQRRLIRQFVVETLTSYIGADPALIEALLTDERLLGDAEHNQPLLEVFAATDERGITATFYPSADASGRGAEVLLADAYLGLQDKEGSALMPAGTKSARLEGYLQVPAPGAYRFYIAMGGTRGSAELRFAHLPAPTLAVTVDESGTVTTSRDEHAELLPGIPYRFTLRLTNLSTAGLGDEVRMLVQGETVPRGSLALLSLYPLTTMARAERALTQLSKTLQLASTLALSARQLRYLLTHSAAFDNLDLKKLPWRDAQQELVRVAERIKVQDPTLTTEAALAQAQQDDPALAAEAADLPPFAPFLRLMHYARLQRELAEGTDDLIDVFEANGAGDTKNAVALIARLTRRDESTIAAAARALFRDNLNLDSDRTLLPLWEALQMVERFGVPVTALTEWTLIVSPAANPALRFAIAHNVRDTVKARFAPEAWQHVAQPIFDRLRQRQRDALAAYIMQQSGLERIEQLFEYFLIDPGMEPVVQTSRVRLAISSIQTFVQRCLLNLETNVHPSVINAERWQWLKRYRVWEANRKIFLYPENWLEPEFRDDKSHLFRELEGALLQGEVSSDVAEAAFLRYLRELSSLARLQMVTTYLEEKTSGTGDSNDSDVLHVIGRTYMLPHKYYYRRYANQIWTPWELVTAEIESDHVVAVVWHDRLHLFWLTFLEKARADTTDSTTIRDMADKLVSSSVNKQVEVRLNWSEYFQGEWTAREASANDNPIYADITQIFQISDMFVHVAKEYENGQEQALRIIPYGAKSGAFRMVTKNSLPQPSDFDDADGYLNPFQDSEQTLVEQTTTLRGSQALQVNYTNSITTLTTTTNGKSVDSLPAYSEVTQPILNGGEEYSVLPTNPVALTPTESSALLHLLFPPKENTKVIAALEPRVLERPFFYQNNRDTFFVRPTWVESKFEVWGSYGGAGGSASLNVPTTANANGAVRQLDVVPFQPVPARAQEIEITRLVEERTPAGTGQTLSNDGNARRRDWLTGSRTTIQYGDNRIGAEGLAEVESS